MIQSDSRSTELAKKMYELRTKKADLDAQANALEAELDQVRAELTAIMTDLGVQKFALDGIGTFYLSTAIYPKLLNPEALISWLDNTGRSDIAPRKVHTPSLKEFIEERMEKDLPVPTADMLDMTPETSVRLRVSNKTKGE